MTKGRLAEFMRKNVAGISGESKIVNITDFIISQVAKYR